MAYSQNDPNWKDKKLGNGKNLGTIGNYGCYVTAIANVCKWAGNDKTPAQIDDILNDNGWFVPSSPGCNDLVGPDDIPARLCSNLKFVGRTNWTSATPMGFFSDASSTEVAYIIKIDASPAAGVQTHYVMVWAKSGTNDLIIDDSWDGVRKKLSAYGNPSTILYSAMKFVKVQPPAPAPQHTPQPVPQPTPAPVTPKPQPTPVPVEDTPVEQPVPETTGNPGDTELKPPKVIVPDPAEHFSIWELLVAIWQKILPFLKRKG